jgi:hypothetical protein
MPAVGDLDSLRKRPGRRFTVSASAIACDHRDLLMLRKPAYGRRLFAVRQKLHRLASFKIADDGSVRMVASPRLIVNADHGQAVRRQAAAPTNNAQQRVVTHRNHQPSRKARRRSASQRQSKMVDNKIESGRAPRGGRQHGIAEPLGKYLPAAEDGVTTETARGNDKTDTSPRQREIGDAAKISAVNPAGRSPAGRANPNRTSMSDSDHDLGSLDRHCVDSEFRRHKLRRTKLLIHGDDSPRKLRQANPELHQK